jgi:hypothetical protein
MILNSVYGKLYGDVRGDNSAASCRSQYSRLEMTVQSLGDDSTVA